MAEELRSKIGMEALERLGGVLCMCPAVPDVMHGRSLAGIEADVEKLNTNA